MTQQKRPFGLMAIMILLLIQALFFGFWGGLLFFANIEDLTRISASAAVPSIIQIVTAVLVIVALPGIWRYKRWGWILLMFQLGISLLAGIWQYFQPELPLLDEYTNYGRMFFNVVIVFYLNQREVQQLFEEQQPQQTEAWI